MQKLYTETGGLPLESTDFLYAATIFSRVEVVVFLEVLRVVSMDVKLGFCTKPTVFFKTHPMPYNAKFCVCDGWNHQNSTLVVNKFRYTRDKFPGESNKLPFIVVLAT